MSAASTTTKPLDFDFLELEYRSLIRRGIQEETCRKYHYGLSFTHGKKCQVANYYSLNGDLEGQKIRFKGKDFSVLGKVRGLFGMHLWPTTGKRIVVTEGELDCLAMAQMNGLKWPVVSIPAGAQGAKKAFERNMEFLCGYEMVVIMFDADEPGLKAAQACAAVLPPGKARVARLPLKDPCEMIQAGRADELLPCMFNAPVYRPDGIVGFEESWEALTKVDTSESLDYPWVGLNNLTHGCRSGELVMITAGTGIGKSTICREIAYGLLKQHPGVGYVALEENVRRSARGLLSLELNIPLHLRASDVSEEDLRGAFDEVIVKGKVSFYRHFGSMASDNLLSKLRYLILGLGSHTIVLDHISIVISGQQGENERRMIDHLMTALRSLTEETGCRMIVVSHLKRTEGTSWEEGKIPRLADLRGSAALEQMSDIVIGAARNQRDPSSRELTDLYVLKNRYSGELGEACTLRYDLESHRLCEVGEFDSAPAKGEGDF